MVKSSAMLKSIILSIHGVRDKQGRKDGGTLFGLVPEEKAYESGVAERAQTWGATFEFSFTMLSRRRFAPLRSHFVG